jgi:hypothetical protein
VAETTRKKRTSRQALVIDLPDNAGGSPAETQDETQAKSAADEQIANALDAEAQGAEAMIYRADPSTGKEAFLDRVSAELVSSEWIGKEYGGGKYRVQFRKPGPNGGQVYGGQKRFEVDPNIPPKAPRWARTAASGPIHNADGSPASKVDDVVSAGILAMINQMQDNSRAQADFFRSVIGDSSRKGPDFLEIVKAATPLIAPLLAMITQKREEKDPLDVALKLLELRGEQKAATGAPTDVMKTVRDVLEIREMFSGSGGGDGPDPMIKLIETVAPQLIDTFKQAMALDAARAGQSMPTQGAAPTPAPVPRVAPPAPPTQADTVFLTTSDVAQPLTQSGEAQVEAWKMLVGSRIPKILKLAELGKNPVLYAQLEEDIIPEIFKPAAREFVEDDNFTDKIYAEYPALLQHKEWMDEFFDVFAAALLGELDDDGGEDEEIEREVEVAESEIPPVSNNGSE